MSADQPSTGATRTPLGARFLTVWTGQSLSLIGSMLANVGIGIWVFLETGSAAALGVLVALATIPNVLMAPFIRLVDRWSRRTVMIWADVVASTGTIIALVLAATGRLEVWHLAVAGFIGGVGSAFQGPAFLASVPSLVEPGAIDRANGLNQTGPAVGIVLGPALAAPIVAWWGIEAVLIVDVITFLVAVIATSSVRFGDEYRRDEHDTDDGSWRAAAGWLRTDGRPLLALIASMATVNFVLAAYNVSIVTLAVEVGGAARSGLVLGAGGVAMLAGSIMLGARGLPRRRIRVFVIALAAIALGTLVAASRPWLPLLILGSMIGLVLVPVVSATVSTIFHERVPAGMQGRVFGIRFAVGQSLGPLGSFATGFAIANVASPAMIDGNWGDRLLGDAIGVGAERGPALLLVAVAFALAGLAFALSRSRLNTEFDALPAGEHAPVPSSRVEDASDDGGVTVVAPDTVQLPT